MRYLVEKTSNISTLIENQLPQFVQENNSTFINFLTSYYESLESKYQPLDIATNLIDYYNIGYYSPNQLVNETKLNDNLSKSSTSISVSSTVGFPEKNGYIRIGKEIIFYKSKTDTSFDDCVRGTSALILENIPKSEIVLVKSTSGDHKRGANVENIAYLYAREFFSRMKAEIAPIIPETLVSDLNISEFLKKIKSFYSAKGSLNSHRILFKILFNDRKFKFLLKKPFTSRARIKVNNYNGFIPKDPAPTIISGGAGYDSRKDSSGNLINPPIIDIIGSGTGEINSSGLQPNNSAILVVKDIDSSGAITSIEVSDTGKDYIGPITTRVRQRSFKQDQRVRNTSGTGYGRVDFWDGFANEIILYDVVGYFKSGDEIIADDGETPRAFIDKALAETEIIDGVPKVSSFRDGVSVVPETQNIEFPQEYTFKTSYSKFNENVVLRCKLVEGELVDISENKGSYILIQDKDTKFGVHGVSIEVDNVVPLRSNEYEFEISSNSDINSIYLNPTTVVVIGITGINSDYTDRYIEDQTDTKKYFTITVDDASRFPLTNGRIFINGKVIEYKNRSFNQFFECTYSGPGTFNINPYDEVISWGRKIYDFEWTSNLKVTQNSYIVSNDNLYKSLNSGTTGSTSPSHTSGVLADGSFDSGDSDFVEWEYVSSNINNYFTYIKSPDGSVMAKLYVIGLPGEITIEDGGSLHITTSYEFSDFDSPNTNIYRFLDSELSNSLATLLSTNFNRSGNIVTDSRFPSYKNLTGFVTQHDFDEYIYVPTGCIPPWWDKIIPDLPVGEISDDNFKKIRFKDQKLLSRWKKSGLIYETQAIGKKEPTKKSIGLDVNAIQLNSYKGNVIEYGNIDRFIIGAGGDYKAPLSDNQIDRNKLPKLVVNSSGSNITVLGQIFRLSSKISKINFDRLSQIWSESTETVSNLSGFSSKPSVSVLNNNPVNIFTISKSDITSSSDTDVNNDTFVITVPVSKIDTLVDTSDGLTVIGPFLNGVLSTTVIPSLVNLKKYYVRKISQQTLSGNVTARYSLHLTSTDAILNQNKVSLRYINTPLNISIGLRTDVLNPSDFIPAELDVSYNKNTGSIDNIIIVNSGRGYVEAPQIIISGGGKLNNSILTIPYSINGQEIIELRGNLTSFDNFYKENNYEITSFQSIPQKFDNAPKAFVDYGSGAQAVAYTSGGSINSVIVISKGNNYFIEPTVNVIGDGTGAQVRANIDNGEIIGFTIVRPGTGYTRAVKIEIIPAGSGSIVSSRLKQWNFNLVHRFSLMNRIDGYGGYVYNSDDEKDLITAANGSKVVNIANNPKEFTQVNKKTDFPASINDAQYLLLKPTQKLIVDYTRKQRNVLIKPLYPNRNLDQNPLTDTEVLSLNIHSAAIAVSYDGIPIYGNKGYSLKYDNYSNVTEIKSRYKLKYSQTASPGSKSFIYNGTTYYVNRVGGPSVDEYPIGSFIEDYEFVRGDENDLDVHNGRFCVTPEFPRGRYCYFATLSSYDPVTNHIIQTSSFDFGGFPYYIGDTFASIPDNYTNNGCRTNDKIPSVFTRIFEKNIPTFSIPGVVEFDGLEKNEFYPSEKTNFDKTKLQTKSLLSGSVDSVIIEYAGTDYKIGDRLQIDNSLSGGAGFSSFVSRVTGKKIKNIFRSFDLNDFSIEIETEEEHGLSVGDYVYFDYEQTNQSYDVYLHNTESIVSRNVQESTDISVESVEKFKDKRFFTIRLNSKFKYNIKIPQTTYILSYDLDKINEYFVESNSNNEIKLDASAIPNNLYLHIGNFIYQIVITNDFYNKSPGDIISRVSSNKFVIKFSVDTRLYETRNLVYSTKSRSAKGSIVDVTISNSGSGYRRLPEITGVSSSTGSGAIIQAYSNTIGKIRNIKYSNVGGGLTSNLNIKYDIQLPTTSKIINNFEIYEVEVIDGGFEYGDIVQIKVNGSYTNAKFNINVQTGIITAVTVIDGGSNFTKEPILEVVSSTGSGARLKAKIRRKNIFPGEVLTLNPQNPFNSNIFPVSVVGNVLHFDRRSSTLEFDEFKGQFKDYDTVYTSDGRPYGKIVNIKRSSAYAKVNPFIKIERSKKDVYGNTSEYLQKLTDSNYYQDWSYSISSSRNIVEWKSEVLTNTHPSGHKLFGKKVIERRKFFFDKPEDVFKSSVIFTAALNNIIDLRLKLTPCKTQTITTNSISFYSENDYIFGVISETIGKISKVNGESLLIEIQNNKSFITGEVIVKIPPTFAYGLSSNTFNHLLIWEGILQEPEYSFEVAPSDLTFGFSTDVIIPKFNINDGEQVINYNLTTDYEYLDSVILNANSNKVSFEMDGKAQEVTVDNINNHIISVGGSVQNPSRLRVQENTVFFDEVVKYDNTRVFAIKNDKFKLLSFSGSAVDDEYTLNYSVTDNCKLLVFYDGISQSHLITNYQIIGGNVIRFPENVEKNKIFGWFIEEDVDCSVLDSTDFSDYRITSIRGCSKGRFSKFIHSSAVKHPSSLYEIRKELLDGTVYADPDRTTVYGFDSNFTYTSPKFSKSCVEVLDPIQFNGSSKTFSLKLMGSSYSPKNGEKSTIVYVNNNVLDPDSYTISNNTITFVNTYSSSDKCIIADFISSFTSNVSNDNCEILDRLNVVQNGVRKTFNLSNNGVPFYGRNAGDVFVIKNNLLKRPELRSYKQKQDSETQSIVENKFTFVNAPTSTDVIDFVYFNRQLEPEPTKNVILDDFRCFDGIRTEFPLTLNGKLYYPQYTKNLFIIRNGVYQKPEIDYYISGANVVFTTAPVKGEVVFTYYSFDGINQNIFIDTFKKFDGIQKDFSLTRNYISSYLDNDYDIMVYRNGVYQHPGSDYTVLNKQTGPYIRFNTAPVPSDDIYIVNFNLSNNDDLIEVTSRFTQVNSTTIAYTNASPSIDKDVFVVFLNGIMQTENSWEYNIILDEMTFDEPVDLSTNKINIFAFKTKKRQIKTTYTLPLDKFKKFDGVQTKFSITKNFIETVVLDEINLQVYRNGVYQYPDVDYTIGVSNNELHIVGQNDAQYIEFTTAPEDGDKIFINNIKTDDIVDITSRFSQLNQYSLSYTDEPLSQVDKTLFLIYRNGTLQDDWIWEPTTNTLSFSEELNLLSDNLKIYAFKTAKRILDDVQILKLDSFRYYNSQQTRFSLTFDYINENISIDSQIQVFRNGVYQHPYFDYNIIYSGYTYPIIEFSAAPTETDEIFVLNYNSSDFREITNQFTQLTQNTLQFTQSVNTNDVVDTSVFLVYVNGILQVEWTFDSNSNVLSFGGDVDLINDKVTIIGFTTNKIKTDDFTIIGPDPFKYFDSVTTDFVLTSNYITQNISDKSKLHVFRNGVYQYSDTDYELVSNSTKIRFSPAPTPSESIFINYFDTNEIVDITSEFSQLTSNSLQYSGPNIDTKVFLIYLNGILQVATSWSYNTSIDVLTLDEDINLINDRIKIFAFTTQKDILDSFVIQSGVTQYNLKLNGVNINDSSLISSELIVVIDGVVQEPDISYTVSNNKINLINQSQNIGSTVHIYSLRSNSGCKKIDSLDDKYDKTKFKLLFNDLNYNVKNSSYMTVVKNDVILVSGSDYSAGNGFLNFSTPLLQTDSLEIIFNAYPLTLNGSIIQPSDLPVVETDLVVSVAGVLQEPGKTYTLDGENIIIPYNNLLKNSNVSVYILGQNYNLRVVDSLDDNFTKKKFKLQYEYAHYNPINQNDLQVIKNGVTLTSGTHYSIGNGFITFTNSITRTDTIELYVKQYRLSQLGSPITTSLPKTQDLIINTSGVVQQPNVVYTVSSNILTLVNPKILTGYNLNIYQIGTNNVDIIDYIDDNYTKKTFKLSSNYVYYNFDDSGEIFVYKNDSLLEKTIDYVTGNGFITFNDTLLETDRLFISTYSYNLIDKSNVIISSNLPDTEEDLLISIDGVCQKPKLSYHVDNSTLTLLNAPELVSPFDYSLRPVYITQVGSSSDDVALMDYLDDNYSKPTYKLAINYKSFNPPNIGDIFVLRNGVLQNPQEDFVIGNGYITFTTNITESDDLFIMYTHGAEEIAITNITNQVYTLGTSISSEESKNVILNLNGAPKFNNVDFIISGNTLTLNEPLAVDPGTTPFILKYPSITFVDNINDCPDGERTRFKLLYTFPNGGPLTNLVENDIKSDADILVSVNGVVQYPGVQYTINSIRTFIDFQVAPEETDEIFFVRMSGNEVVNLSLDSGKTYSMSSATQNNINNLVVFSNNQWKFEERGEFTLNSAKTKVTLAQSNTSQYVFGIKFIGVFGLLDQIHTPYDGSRKLFNMFEQEENFVPIGTISDDTTPDETSIIIVKNGKILDPKVDYILSGDIESQILFAVAPVSTDTIHVKSVGSFLKLDSITSGFGGRVFDMKLNGCDYYPNSDISRPREHENQILVLRNGAIQNPIYDYYIHNNKLIFNNNLPAGTTKLVILDFKGTRSDVEVFNKFNQISVGDEIFISGETSSRKVTSVLSPTVLKTESYTGSMPTAATLSATYSSGSVTDINVTNGGVGYEHPVILRTFGSGVGAKAVANVEYYDGGVIRDESVEIQYPGYNVYSNQSVLPTAYASSYKKQPLSKSQIRKATKLTNNINSSVETILLNNTKDMMSNSPSITVSSLTGSGAQFKIFVSKGSIRKVEVVNSGIGYDDRSIDIELVGGGGSGCVLEPVLDAMGRFTNVIVRNGGVGYDTFRVIVYDPNDTTVDPEFIEYTYVTENGIDGCTRGSGAESYNANTMVYFDSYL